MLPPQQPYVPKLKTTTQPTKVWKNIQSVETTITIIITPIFNTTSSYKIICWIIQSSYNSVYHKIFILIHNLIICTTWSTDHIKSDKNTITMAKSTSKCLKNLYNQRTIIRRHVNVKCTKKLLQQSSWKKEAAKVNAIMEQWDKSDRNRYG